MICTRPFEWYEVHPDGSVFLCCPAWLKRPVGNLLTQSVEEIWNGARAREIRKTILNGSYHCCNSKRCPFLANGNGPVMLREAIADREVRLALENGLSTLPYRPKKLNLCFDHSCNIACPTCRTVKRQANGVELERARRIAELVLDQLIPNATEVTL
ncbi:MAG: hypothetical protein C0622_11875, partial [Desulfuromonas sp.]